MADLGTFDFAEKEQMQERHYALLNKLQSMARDIPNQYQQRLPYDLLSGLASALLDGTLYDIVCSLKEVQHLEERNLFNQRNKLINDYKVNKAEMMKRHKDKLYECEARPHNLQMVLAQCEKEMMDFEQKHEEELKRREMKAIRELDMKVMEQQSILQSAGVPGFYATNNPVEVKVQMYLLDFIIKVGACKPDT